jgi:hypothetical protein
VLASAWGSRMFAHCSLKTPFSAMMTRDHGCPVPSSKKNLYEKVFWSSSRRVRRIDFSPITHAEKFFILFLNEQSPKKVLLWHPLWVLFNWKKNEKLLCMVYWRKSMRLTRLEISRKPFPYRYFLQMVLGTHHHGSSWPKMGFSARNGRTCVTPQALASTKTNGLWTHLDNYITKIW